MSMLRCLYGRVKLVKCAFGESGASITLNVVSDSRSANQYIINLPVRHINGMTFSDKILASSSQQASSIRVMPSAETEKSDLSFVRNGLILDSTLRNTSISEGYYRNEWGKGSRRYSGANGEKANNDQSSKCEFNFSSINVRLLETFGFIGTAVAVGIDVRSRINEWKPYQNRRGIHDFCQYHHHYNNKTPFNQINNGPPNQPSLSRVLDGFSKQSKSQAVCPENDPCLTTIRYCGSCTICRYLFDKLLHLYVTAFPALPSSTSTSVLNILPDKSSFLPKVGYNQSDSSQEDETDGDYVDGCDGPSIADAIQFNQLKFDSSSTNGFTDSSQSSSSSSAEPNRSSDEDVSRVRQRKKSIFQISDDENQQLQSLAEKNSQSSKSDYISLSESSQESTSDSVWTTDSVSPTSTKIVQDDNDDIAAVFRMASIEYADQLNNLVAISLMSGHKPDEAMQCWSSCEASSRAFFNMGVAYESGRHAKNARPDMDRAHDCYALAASMGHRDAIYNLAIFYLYGKGKVEANVERGLELLEIAAAKGVEAAQHFCAELHRSQMLDELRQSLQRKPSTVDSVKSRPLRTSLLRPSASMFGTATARLRPKHSSSKPGAEGSALKRNNSAPNLFDLNSSPNVIASK